MNKFKLNKDIKFAIDLKGVAITDTKKNSVFLEYPEAAVWLTLVNEYNKNKSLKMLEAILDMNKDETKKHINKCIDKWKKDSNRLINSK